MVGDTPAQGPAGWVGSGWPASRWPWLWLLFPLVPLQPLRCGWWQGPTRLWQRPWARALKPCRRCPARRSSLRTTGSTGRSLWKTDGTEAGTVMVKDIALGGSSRPDNLTAVDGVLFFSVWDGAHRDLWKSDGTEAGTVLVKDFSTGWGPRSSVAMNGALYFEADDGVHGGELWKSDGAGRGDRHGQGHLPQRFITGWVRLVRRTRLPVLLRYRRRPWPGSWTSDGSESGTVLVKNIKIGGRSQPSTTSWSSGDACTSPPETESTADELWRTNGTSAGTTLVKDINPGGSSSPHLPTSDRGRQPPRLPRSGRRPWSRTVEQQRHKGGHAQTDQHRQGRRHR